MIRRSVSTLSSALAAAAVFALALTASAQQTSTLQPRVTAPIDNANRVTLPGSRSPRANPAADIGAVPPGTKLQGISLVFSRTAAQQADLDALVLAQQQVASPLYHHWLTPDQFAARFGVAASDIASVETWLQYQGFSIDSVSRSRNRILFSGTASLVASAFGAPLHYYRSPSEVTPHFAPSTDLTLPAALASSVLTINNLSSFRPHTHIVQNPARPRYTVQDNQAYFLTPPDVATIYDIKPAYSQGFTGTGQTIAIIGQSAIVSSDITTFQTLLGQTAKAPGTFLVPGSGTSTVYAGDEGESDIDLEYSGAIAPGATINLYYVGNGQNYNAFDALQYIVDNNAGNIISSSYGDCEFDAGSKNVTAIDLILEQAVAQGETVISATGDTGSTDCAEDTNLTFAQQTALAVDYPASSIYTLAAGGTEFPAADVTAPNATYWSTAGSTDVISTALSYIPEQAWNDDAVFEQAILAGEIPSTDSPLSSGGGGVSIYEPLPSWQTGVPGIPTGTNRFVPDLSLAASSNFPGYLFCSSDTSDYQTGQTGSCTSSGFSNVGGQYLYYTAAGGTSFVAPILSGLVAVINQAKGYTTGQGLINPTLYKLAADSTTYASAFHDITSGSNACQAGSVYCGTGAQTTDFVTTTGYDEATGLGSIDFNNLLTAWPASGTGITTGDPTTIAFVPTTTTPAAGASDPITITVLSNDNVAITGTIAISVDGVAATPLTAPSGTYTFSSSLAGSHSITAVYSGDSTHASTSASLTLHVTTVGSFTLAVPSISIVSGASGSATLTLTPTGGYTGTVNLSGVVPAALTNACIFGPESLTVTSTAAVTGAYTFYTSPTTCAAQGAVQGKRLIRLGTAKTAALNHNPPSPSPWKRTPLPIAAAALFTLACFRRRSKLLRAGMALGLLLVLSLSGLGLTGCSNNTAAPTPTAPAGTYNVTVTGTDSVNPAITSSVTFTVTITN